MMRRFEARAWGLRPWMERSGKSAGRRVSSGAKGVTGVAALRGGGNWVGASTAGTGIGQQPAGGGGRRVSGGGVSGEGVTGWARTRLALAVVSSGVLNGLGKEVWLFDDVHGAARPLHKRPRRWIGYL